MWTTSIPHWGRVTHVCVGKLTITGSDNGLSPGRRQAIIWTIAGILWIGPLGTNFSEILIRIETFSFERMHLKMSSAKWRPFVSASMWYKWFIHGIKHQKGKQSLYLQSGWTSYRKISWSLEAARLGDIMIISAAAEVPAKFQNDGKGLNMNLAAWRFHEILWSFRLVNRGPVTKHATIYPNILNLVCKSDIKEIHSNMSNPSFKKNVREQKHLREVDKCRNGIPYINHSR